MAVLSDSAYPARLRVVLGKLGLDGHDRGVRMLARELRERGCEVILLSTGTSAKMFAAVARDEDADVIGVSILSGAHLTLVPTLLAAVAEAGVSTPVLCGGMISSADAAVLVEQGVQAVAPVGTSVTDAAELIVQTAAACATTGAHR